MEETFSCELEQVPDLLAIVAEFPRQYPFFLDSAAAGPLGRYSILFRAGKQVLSLAQSGVLNGPGNADTFLERLKQWYMVEGGSVSEPTRWPFCGGWFVYLGYELAAEVEPVLELPKARDGLPVAFAVRCEAALIIEHGEQDSAFLVGESPQIVEQMRTEISGVSQRHAMAPPAVDDVRADPDENFTLAVEDIKDYLAGGDVFQVNLSRAWNGSFSQDVDSAEVYRCLRNSNPAPFAGLMYWEDMTLMSSSPERLVEVRGDLIQTRPIAGTHPRHSDRQTDLALSRDMLAHPKERAEHIMLIDLERNDLGRVCRNGSVEVNELMVVESYAHVHHIVSNVRGKLEPGITPADVIRAGSPATKILRMESSAGLMPLSVAVSPRNQA